ncbi:MAG: tryptophan-rich sensory protein [Nitriliruptor sp.]|nr:MAG: tryptophan-rich sensory protein [Nitriliruptor sp.]
MAGEAGTDDPTTASGPSSRRVAAAAVFLLVAFAAGGIGSITQGTEVGVRYLALERPVWAPPSWLFGVVWPVLYLLIGVAAWRVWRAAGGVRAAGTALGLWLAQLVVNAVWPGVFFGLEAFGPAIAVILLLDVLVVATIVVFPRHDRLAAWLLVPYLVWILYATALNISLQILN